MYYSMDEILDQPDQVLFYTVGDVVWAQIRNFTSDAELDAIPAVKFCLVTANVFDEEMQEGGFRRFVQNAGRLHAPVLMTALKKLGAERHLALVRDFCQENDINFWELRALRLESREAFLEKLDQYPFWEFDKAFRDLEQECSLAQEVGRFIRNNVELFLEQ